MSALVTIVVPSLLFGLAYTLGRRELALYRRAGREDADLFVYSRGRLLRRMAGVVVLGLAGATFAALGLAPPRSSAAASAFVAAILAEVALLLALPLWDLWETARTARPGQGITHQDAGRPRPRPRRAGPRPGGTGA